MHKPIRVLGFFLAAIFVAHLLDGFFYHYFFYEPVYDRDWGRALRVAGFLPIWLAAAGALALHDGPTHDARRAWLLAGSPALSGLAGEVLKLIVRRERPNAHAGHYVFRSFADRPFSSGGLALPSSHAVVAFGAAAMLGRLFPRARHVFWAIAWGCGLTRVAAGAHFFSDVVVSAIVGWSVAWMLFRHWPAAGDVPATGRHP